MGATNQQILEILLRLKSETDKGLKQFQGDAEKAKKGAEELGKSMTSSTQRAGQFANAIASTSTTLARSASTLGLPIQALRALDDVMDVAALGLSNLTTSTVGFNAATAGAAGAGLALGFTLGGWIRQIPGVSAAVDELAEKLFKLAGAMPSVQESAAAAQNWSIQAKKFAEANEALLRSQTKDMTAEQAKVFLGLEKELSLRQKIVAEKDKAEAAEKKALELGKQKAEATKRALERELEEHKRWAARVKELLWTVHQEERKKWAATLALVDESLTRELELEQQRMDKAKRAFEEQTARSQDQMRLEDAIRAMRLQALASLSDALHQAGSDVGGFGGALLNLGASGVDVFLNLQNQARGTAERIVAAANAVNAAVGAFQSGSFLGGAGAGASAGAAFGPWGAAIGGLAGGLLGLFGGAKKAREEMEKLKASFLQSQGGMVALSARAREASISLEAMFKAKSAKALEAAIAGIKGQLDEWAEAQEILKNGAEKWGIAIADMGKGFAALQLDARAKEMALFFAAATGAGANMGAVTQGMAKDVLDLVAQYRAAGLSIPETLKPVLQAMLDQKKLVDENGKAYGSFEEAGISFGKTMEGVLSGIETAVTRLMQVLARGFNIPLNFDVTGVPGHPGGGGGNGPGGGHGPNHFPENAFGGFYQQPTLAWMAESGPAKSGGEFALPKEMLQEMLNAAAAMALARHGGGGRQTVVNMHLNRHHIGRAVSELTQPGGPVRVHHSAITRGRGGF